SWFVFSGTFLFAALGILPGLYIAATWSSMRLGKIRSSFRQSLAQHGQVLVPLGLMAWIVFTISFAFVKFAYVLPAISDPFGWGWNLVGISKPAGVGAANYFSLILQVIVLTVGLFWSSRVAIRISESIRQAIPMISFAGLFSLIILWLLVG
ncbi:MAG: hypothetical protein CVU46_17955, partial [Chloroflexi bacterium HGW-Chloroflexi-8]